MMKKCIVLIMILFSYSFLYAEELVIPGKPYANTAGDNTWTGDNTFDNGVTVGATPPRVTFTTSGEYISGATNGTIGFFDPTGNWIDFELDSSNTTINASSGIDIVAAPLITNTARRGINLLQLISPVVGDPIAGKTIHGALYTNGLTSAYIGTSNVIGLETGSGAYYAPAGSSTTAFIGARIYGVKGTAATTTTSDITGLEVHNSISTVVIEGDVTGISILESISTLKTGDQTMLLIEKPTSGGTGTGADYQIVLEGEETGTGIWFGSKSGCRVYQQDDNATCLGTGTMLNDGATKDLCSICP